VGLPSTGSPMASPGGPVSRHCCANATNLLPTCADNLNICSIAIDRKRLKSKLSGGWHQTAIHRPICLAEASSVIALKSNRLADMESVGIPLLRKSIEASQVRHDRVEKPLRTSGNLLSSGEFFMGFRGPKAHLNRRRSATGERSSPACSLTGPTWPGIEMITFLFSTKRPGFWATLAGMQPPKQSPVNNVSLNTCVYSPSFFCFPPY
jgi:hypothetical protein